MKQKSLILMISVALIIVMAVSVVSAWPWGATGNAVLKSGNEINLYDGDDYEFEIGSNAYKISEVKLTENEIRFVLGGRIYGLVPGEELTSNEGLVISLVYIDQTLWRKVVGKNPNRARVKISEGGGESIPTSGCSGDNYQSTCGLYEDKEMDVLIGESTYKFGINYIDNDEVRLIIGGDFVTPRMSVGNGYNYAGKFKIFIKDIQKIDVAGEVGYVMFHVESSEVCVLNEGETTTCKGYGIEIEYINNDEVVFVVNEERVPSNSKLSESDSIKLSDGSYLKVIDISKLEVSGEVGSVVFSIEKSKTSSEVTYAGVLEMLGKCKNVDASKYYPDTINLPEDYNCANVCLKNGLTCALGIGLFKANNISLGDQKVVFRDCSDSTSPINTYLNCYCCSAP